MNTRVHPARHRAPMTPDVMPEEAVLPVDDKRKLLRYVLAALAYLTQKALRDAPAEFKNFRAAEINPERLGLDQAEPHSPDEIWPEAPLDWRPPSQR
jgi:hypothetical protein